MDLSYWFLLFIKTFFHQLVEKNDISYWQMFQLVCNSAYILLLVVIKCFMFIN